MLMAKHQLLNAVQREIDRGTGRRYQIDLEPLDLRSLQEMLRLLRDLEMEKHLATRRARMMPWRLV